MLKRVSQRAVRHQHRASADIVGDSPEGIASAAHALLNSVQDYVSEELREPWPSLALPEAVVEGSTLRMWFGDRSAPALAVSEIELTALQ